MACSVAQWFPVPFVEVNRSPSVVVQVTDRQAQHFRSGMWSGTLGMMNGSARAGDSDTFDELAV